MILKACPFCGDAASTYTENLDERVGYNHIVHVRCKSCGASKSEYSKRDKNGWCNEDTPATLERAINKWNERVNI